MCQHNTRTGGNYLICTIKADFVVILRLLVALAPNRRNAVVCFHLALPAVVLDLSATKKEGPLSWRILSNIHDEVIENDCGGEVASYIPQLGNVDPGKFGLHLATTQGGEFGVGENDERFSIQSITKVLLFARAKLEIDGDQKKRVGVEPSGDPFNSLVQLEYERGIPRNPMINAGAIVICDVLVELLDDPKSDYLSFVRKLAGCETIDYDQSVADSEWSCGFRNRSIINLMKGFGNIRCDIDEVLDMYFHACSLAMSCRELARTFSVFANAGALVENGERILSPSRTKRINAVMQTCGLYDEAGEFAFRVGLPAKSGVGGGIAAVYPGHYAVAVWSPRLNKKGNSAAGFRALELLTDHTGLSIF